MDEQKELSYRPRWGLLAAVQLALLRRLQMSLGLRVYGIYTRPLESTKHPDAAMPGFSYRLFVHGEADELIARARNPELDLPPQFVRDAFEKGDVCDAVLHDNEIVSYSWSAFTPTHDVDGVYIEFGEKYRYGYKLLTLPEYRGHHLPRIFKPFRDRYCVDIRGRTHSIVFVAVGNHSSTTTLIAQGNCRIGFAGYLKRGSVFRAFRTPGVRRLGFNFFVPENKVR